MKALRIVALVVIFVALLAGFTAAQLSIGLMGTALSPSFYLSCLDSQGAFDTFSSASFDLVAPYLERFPSDYVESAREAWAASATPDWFRLQFAAAAVGLSDYLLGRTAVLEVSIPLGELRETFVEEFSTRTSSYATQMLRDGLADFPDAITLTADMLGPDLSAGSSPATAASRALWVLRNATVVLWSLAGGLALLMVLAALLAGLRGATRWVGLAAGVAGLLVFTVCFLLERFFLPGLLGGLELADGVLPAGMGFIDQITGLTSSALAVFRLTGLAFAGGGLVLLIAGSFIRSPGSRSAGAGRDGGRDAGGLAGTGPTSTSPTA